MASRVGIFEKHSFVSQFVDRWRFVERAAVATHIRPSKIIHEKKNDIELLLAAHFNAGCGGYRDTDRKQVDDSPNSHGLILAAKLIFRNSDASRYCHSGKQ